jgi:ATP-binding cassette subfamily F protein uup
MAYINIQGAVLTLGDTPLFKGVNLAVEKGEKVALVGRNGSGKSTLLRLIEGSIEPDSGAVAIQKGIHSAYLPQVVPDEMPGTVFDVVAGGIKEHWDLVTRYHSVNARLSQEDTPALHDELDRIHNELEAKGGWDRLQQVSKVISQLGLDTERVFNSLSAGLKRQALLGKALAGEPDILLLDEPTNHMDIDSIKRLEELLMRFTGALILVTHDRMFLQRIATRIVEIDRGALFDLPCDYETFLVRRSAAREVEDTENALFDKRLQKEEQWIRQGIKARRTRNEGRVRELEKLREIRRARRERPGIVKIEVQKAGRSGKLVTEVEDVSYDYGGAPVISNLFTTILKGDRIGILGPNGCGKTTLLRILLGDLKPVSGKVRLGTNLQICYFDQLREQLADNKTVLENVVESADIVTINGKDRHVMGYLQDFLFTPEQAYSYVSVLSGGERNRLMLARLFTRPSNLLVLDEPTNDLDIETISVLEDFLMKYTGTILLVSHDRAFINNVVTSTLVFEGNAVVNEYVGGYDDWLSQRWQETKPAKDTPVKKVVKAAKAPKAGPKISFQQKKELELLPHTIELLEVEQKLLSQAMGEPELYKKDKSEILAMQGKLESVKKQLTEAYARWQELEHLNQ